LTWGSANLIGHLDTPPIPKLGKFYKVFEHVFNLKMGVLYTCLGGSLIRCGLLGMIHMTCGPLEGVLVYFCRTLPTGWMLDPTSGAPFDDEHCTLMMEDVNFGGILA
jgi:hypothetical protein